MDALFQFADVTKDYGLRREAIRALGRCGPDAALAARLRKWILVHWQLLMDGKSKDFDEPLADLANDSITLLRGQKIVPRDPMIIGEGVAPPP